MAENLDTPQSFGNFGIENTMEMGMGNAELLNDLMSPETALVVLMILKKSLLKNLLQKKLLRKLSL